MKEDIETLSITLRKKFDAIEDSDFGWHNPPLDVVDCVLSLNRKYTTFVIPKLNTFKNNHPEIETLTQLRDLIDSYESPLRFSQVVLNYNDENRANTLRDTVEYFIDIQSDYEGLTEQDRLHNWAISVNPKDAKTVSIKGFGIAAFQYMRMLFGAQTTKPDTHIIDFVSSVIGRRVGEEEAIYLLEEAAHQVGLPVRDVDNKIWEELSSSK